MSKKIEFQRKDGSTYAPKGKANYVCKKGEFRFSAVGLDHGHIYGMCNGLIEAGAELVSVYDPDSEKISAFLKEFPEAQAVDSMDQILEDPSIHLIACAAIPRQRGEIGVKAMLANKDFFADKPPLFLWNSWKNAAECP